MPEKSRPSIADLFPESGRLLLTGGGKEFIERIGVEATRRVIHHVMMGENLRQQTEPLTRRRVAQISMKYWPRELAQRLGARLGIKHELQRLDDGKISDYLETRLDAIPVQEFLAGISPADLEQDTEMPEAAEQVSPFEDEE